MALLAPCRVTARGAEGLSSRCVQSRGVRMPLRCCSCSLIQEVESEICPSCERWLLEGQLAWQCESELLGAAAVSEICSSEWQLMKNPIALTCSFHPTSFLSFLHGSSVRGSHPCSGHDRRVKMSPLFPCS